MVKPPKIQSIGRGARAKPQREALVREFGDNTRNAKTITMAKLPKDRKYSKTELKFLVDACTVLQDLNDLFKELYGEDDRTREIDSNVKQLKKSVTQ